MCVGPLSVLLEEVSVQVLCPFFHRIVCLPGVELKREPTIWENIVVNNTSAKGLIFQTHKELIGALLKHSFSYQYKMKEL